MRAIRRLSAGRYITVDGRYEFYSVRAEENNGYHTKGEVYWMFCRVGGEPHDTFATLKRARQVLEASLEADRREFGAEL